MRTRISRLGRLRRWITRATNLVTEVVRLVEAVTLLTKKLSGLLWAVIALITTVGILVASLR